MIHFHRSVLIVQKPSHQPRRHLIPTLPIFGTNALRMELLRPFSSTIYIGGLYLSQRVCPSRLLTKQIQPLYLISESNSVSNEVLQAGHYFWVTSMWYPHWNSTNLNNTNLNSTNLNYTDPSTVEMEVFYHHKYRTNDDSIDLGELYYGAWSNTNITDMADEVQGRIIRRVYI